MTAPIPTTERCEKCGKRRAKSDGVCNPCLKVIEKQFAKPRVLVFTNPHAERDALYVMLRRVLEESDMSFELYDEARELLDVVPAPDNQPQH
jgi:hypothetical protein